MIVTNHKPNVKYFGDDLRLLPGANDVPDVVWSAVKARFPKAAEWLTPSLKYPRGEVTEQVGDSLADLPELRACEIVLETADPGLLAKWRATETRPKVLAAFKLVDEQIAIERKRALEKKARKEAAAQAAAR
jgi:hypothetical protein